MENTNTSDLLLSYFGWKREILLIRGLPGSGKSTLGKILLGKNPTDKVPALVEADLFYTIGDKYLFNKEMTPLAHQWCLSESFRRLWFFNRVVVANTFVRREQMFPYIENARKFQIKLWVINAPNNDLPTEELVKRNVHNVPETVINDMRNSWETISQEEVNILLNLPVDLRGQPLVVPQSALTVGDLFKEEKDGCKNQD
jgi:predicted kinase